jgi:hypothetical protein
MKQNFIKTNDTSTATALLELGYQQVANSDGFITFINNDQLHFSKNIDKSKIQYSNILCI